MIDKVKNDINFRNKVIRGAIVFVVIMTLSIVLILAIDSEETNPQVIPQDSDTGIKEQVLAIVPADTTKIIQKSNIYSQMDYLQNEENKGIRVVTDESVLGKTQEEIAENEKKEQDEIEEYMKQRRQQVQANNDYHRASRSAVEAYQPPPTPNRRRYNPYATSQDWEDQEISSYQTGREKERIQQESAEEKRSARNIKKKKAKTFDELSEIEQRKILLETGKSSYEETAEFSAMIMTTGTVKNGQTITLITKEDAFINFEKIPKGTTMAGIVSFGENRLHVNFSTIRIKKKIIKVNLTLYGLDGLEGLPVGSDVFNKELEDTGTAEVTQEIQTTRVGRIASSLLKSSKGRKEQKVDLGRDIMCILVNNNIEE